MQLQSIKSYRSPPSGNAREDRHRNKSRAASEDNWYKNATKELSTSPQLWVWSLKIPYRAFRALLIGCSLFRAKQHAQPHQNSSSSTRTRQSRRTKTSSATLIPHYDILIFCETASKTVLAKYAKPSKTCNSMLERTRSEGWTEPPSQADSKWHHA